LNRLLVLLAVPALVAATTAPSTDRLVLTGTPQQGGILRGQLPPGATGLTLDGTPVAVTPDGGFLIGFGRDGPAAAVLAWTSAGTAVTHPLAVEPRQWNIQSLPTLPPHPVPDAEFEARRPAEVAQITAARADISAETGWRQSFIAPAQGRISGVYGSQRILSGTPMSPHAGLDIAAGAGATVVAPAAGIVRLANGPFTLEGNLVMIDHGMGLVSAFMHLSRIDVKPGDHVTQGQPIGAVGATGRATGPHLHWGVTWTNVRVDPAALVTPSPAKVTPNG
jgi:murein DD-endopeptidase MepM/ murein hydrolase activator NlpD